MHIFGMAGMLIGGAGLLVSAYLVALRLIFGTPLADRPLFIVSLLAAVVGLQFIALGVLADIVLRTYYGQRKVKNYRIEQKVNFDRP
jgi:uncharacterized integral membrane protein